MLSLSTGAAVLVALLVGAAGALYAYVTRHFGYWRRRGVPYLRPLPVAGNLKDVLLFRKPFGVVLRDVYTQMKDQPYVGMFFFDQPVLFVKDIELWKTIVIKDCDHFEDRGFAPLQSVGIFSETLFGTKGKKWKQLRTKLSPAFTLGKIRKFYILLEQKAANFDHYFDDVVKSGAPCDVANACARYTMDAIATVGFGIETTALTDDNDPLHRLLRKIFVYSKIFTLVSVATFVDVPLLHLLKVSLVPAPLIDFLRHNVWASARERLSRGSQGERGDFLDLLLELRDKGRIAVHDDDDDDDVDAKAAPDTSAAIYMDGDVLVAQAFSILAAGFDTTSTTMSSLYELAMNSI
ncbi:hypothetical protein R5R35_008874 [Gryllus longicercus]|uniref:Cytochrome P450 n=1 Tax=Gryllus longicercus TaxID=2509291 RepID=A0AAN9V8I3_9ORTH